MMSVLLASFARPWLLLAIPLASAALIYIYRRRKQGQRLLVSSTLLLQLITTQVQKRSTFKPPWRFFLELLIVILLTLVAADLVWHNKTNKVAIVVDNSFNTFARVNNKTRIEILNEQVHSIAATLPSNSIISLFIAAPHLKELTNHKENLNDWRAALKLITPAFAAANIDAIFSNLYRTANFHEVYLVSATAYTNLNTGEKVKLRSLQNSLGPFNNNIAISTVSYQSTISATSRARLLVSIKSFADVDVPLNLTGSCIDRYQAWHQLDLLPLVVEAGSSKAAELPLSIANLLGCRVTIKISAENARRDLLAEDNLFWVETTADQRSLVYVGSLSAQETGLKNLPNYNITYLNDKDSQVSPAINNARLVLFHRLLPEQLPDNNWLLIMPGSGNSQYAALNTTETRITNWNRKHPIARYLQPNLIKPTLMQNFSKPALFESLIDGDAAAVLLAGQLETGRAVISGIELLPYSGVKDTTLSVLLLNSLKWLSESDAKQNKKLSLYSNNSNELSIEYLDNEFSLPASDTKLAVPGLIKIKQANYATIQAINFFDEKQSDLNYRHLINLVEPLPLNSEQAWPIKNWVLLFAISLLLIDLLSKINLRNIIREKKAV